jgi:hypothetical protein
MFDTDVPNADALPIRLGDVEVSCFGGQAIARKNP